MNKEDYYYIIIISFVKRPLFIQDYKGI